MLTIAYSHYLVRSVCESILPQDLDPPNLDLHLLPRGRSHCGSPLGLFVVYPVHGYTTRVVPQVALRDHQLRLFTHEQKSPDLSSKHPPLPGFVPTLWWSWGGHSAAPAVGSCTPPTAYPRKPSALVVHLAINQFDLTVESHLKQISGKKSVWLVGIGAYIARSQQGAS